MFVGCCRNLVFLGFWTFLYNVGVRRNSLESQRLGLVEFYFQVKLILELSLKLDLSLIKLEKF